MVVPAVSGASRGARVAHVPPLAAGRPYPIATDLTDPAAATAAAPRLQSLDVFRGLTIAAMLLVNNPGSWSHVYRPLEHAAWNGFTPTDLVFPFFLFIVGVAIDLLARRRLLDRGAAPRRALPQGDGPGGASSSGWACCSRASPTYDLPHIRSSACSSASR